MSQSETSFDFNFTFNMSTARVRAEASTSIRGIPREKKSRPYNVSKEVRKKRRVIRLGASMGIVGLEGSGRKFLAYRLANMNRGVIRQVPIAFFYTITYGGRFVGSVDFYYSRYFIRILVYIIPEPELPPPRTRSDAMRYSGPPLYLQNWNNFSCLVMAFDVTSLLTFLYASLFLAAFRRHNVRVPTCFIVGNKHDQRFEPPPDPDVRFVDERTAHMEAEHLGGTYFEVSAKYNINVAPLLASILECAIRRTEDWYAE